MKKEEVVKLIRKNRKIFMYQPVCLNNECIHLKNTKRRSFLVEYDWYVDVNGYSVEWRCPYCSYNSLTGNKHEDLKGLFTITDSARMVIEIKHLLFNPQGVASN